jgi:hypothetical protein
LESEKALSGVILEQDAMTGNHPAVQPPRPPFQFRLRTLLLMTATLAVALSLLRWLYTNCGLEIVGLVMFVAIGASFHAGCALWMVDDARERGKCGILFVALFAYFGPFGVIPWLLLRPHIKAVRIAHDG